MSLLDVIEQEIGGAIDPAVVKAVEDGGRGKTSIDTLIEGIRQGFPQGQRNTGMTAFAGLLRARGFDYPIIGALLESVNKSSGTGLEPREIAGIARSVSRYTPKPENRPCAVADILSVAEAGQKWRELRKLGCNCKSGYSRLDRAIPYYQVGEVFLLGGRSGTCKTTAGLQIGIGYAHNLGGHCLFVSLEMDAAAVYFRVATVFLSENQPVNSDTALLLLMDNEQLETAISRKFDKLLIVDKDSLSLDRIEQYLIIARERGEVSVLVIDYMGYISDTQAGNTYERVSRIAKGVKSLAKRQQVRIILLCQTSREGKSGSEPVQLWHFRDSGAIEESADYAIGIWHSSSDETRLHCEALKTRHTTKGQRFDFINQGLFLIEDEFKPDTRSDIF